MLPLRLALLCCLLACLAEEAVAITQLKKFVSIDNVRCDANNKVWRIYKDLSEKACFRKCKKKRKCNLASYNKKKERCNIFKECEDGLLWKNEEDWSTSGRVGKNGYWVPPKISEDKPNLRRTFLCGGDGEGIPEDVMLDSCEDHGRNWDLDKCMECCDKVDGCKVATVSAEWSEDWFWCHLATDCSRLYVRQGFQGVRIKDRPTD